MTVCGEDGLQRNCKGDRDTWYRACVEARRPIVSPNARGASREMARYPVRLAPAVARFSAAPLAKVLGVLERRWAVLTLEALGSGHCRFNELQRSLDGITHKVLIDTLRSLQREGFVRGPLTEEGMTEYRVTALGSELVDLVDEIRSWSDRRSDQLTGPRRAGC